MSSPDIAILKLNKAGGPQQWLSLQDAATTIAKGLVLWSLGNPDSVLYGGVQRATGARSSLAIPPVIAVDGRVKEKTVPVMTNTILFARDGHTCLYCGNGFPTRELSRDHVVPRSQGGRDSWTNCVTACKRCNHHKADRTPEQAGMELLAVPFAPNLYEHFYLQKRRVLADQMDYLSARFENVLVA